MWQVWVPGVWTSSLSLLCWVLSGPAGPALLAAMPAADRITVPGKRCSQALDFSREHLPAAWSGPGRPAQQRRRGRGSGGRLGRGCSPGGCGWRVYHLLQPVGLAESRALRWGQARLAPKGTLREGSGHLKHRLMSVRQDDLKGSAVTPDGMKYPYG